jgi:dTDP-4-dehydrorhamnose 3,5-epimerase
METQTIGISGVIIIQPKVFGDTRGYFFESFQEHRYEAAGIKEHFIQDNFSSSTKGVLRGLHYQLKHPQGKLVTVIKGKVLDVMVDIRVGSPTFGKSYSIILDEKSHNQVYVPPGLAHGFYVLTDDVVFAYKCTDVYHPEDEYGVLWNDPDLGIEWGIIDEPTLSEKDKKHPLLKNIPAVHLPRFQSC